MFGQCCQNFSLFLKIPIYLGLNLDTINLRFLVADGKIGAFFDWVASANFSNFLEMELAPILWSFHLLGPGAYSSLITSDLYSTSVLSWSLRTRLLEIPLRLFLKCVLESLSGIFQ